MARLRQVSAEHRLQGRNEQADALDNDLRLIQRAPGEDLYTVVQEAQETAFRLERSLLYKDAQNFWPAGPLSLGLALGGMGLGAGLGLAAAHALKIEPAWLAVPLALLGSSAMALPMVTQARAERAREVVAAVDRRYLEAQS